MVSENIFIDLDDKQRVSAVLAGPGRGRQSNRIGVAIAHGAGNDMHNPLIVAVSEELAAEGFATLRFNFLYKEKGKKSPDPQPRLMHTWRCALETLRSNHRFPVEKIIAAGKSMGGRVASQMAADGKIQVSALIFLGYPLHAPGRKDRLRDEHLYRIRMPMLFFAGTRDPLCDLERLKTVLKRLPCPHDLEIIDGGNHSFTLVKSANRSEAEVHGRITAKCLNWLQLLSFPLTD